MKLDAKEKASILVNRFYDKIEDVESVDSGGWISNSHLLDYSVKYAAKECALICVDEILGYMGADRGYEFWQEVRKEIENYA